MPVIHRLAVIVAECLLVHVPEKAERLDRNVGSLQASFQKAPEVLHAVGVGMTLDVLDGVIHDLMLVVGVQSFIRLQGVGEDFGSGFDVFSHDTLK